MASRQPMIRNNVHRKQLAVEISDKAGLTTDQADKLIILMMKAIEVHLMAGRSVELRGHCVFFMQFAKSKSCRTGFDKGGKGTVINTEDRWVPGFRWSDKVKRKATRLDGFVPSK